MLYQIENDANVTVAMGGLGPTKKSLGQANRDYFAQAMVPVDVPPARARVGGHTVPLSPTAGGGWWARKQVTVDGTRFTAQVQISPSGRGQVMLLAEGNTVREARKAERQAEREGEKALIAKLKAVDAEKLAKLLAALE